MGTFNFRPIEQQDVIDTNRAVLQNKSAMTAYGTSERVDNIDRFYESDTANLLTDKVGDSIRLSDGLHDRKGTELVQNNIFNDTDISYITLNNATASVVDGMLELTNTTAGYGSFSIPIITEIGHSYSAKMDITDGTNTLSAMAVGSTDTGSDLYYSGTVANPVTECTFIATDTTSWIRGWGDNVDGHTVKFDNVYSQEVPSATTQLAPFAPTSTDELLDDKVNGLTCQIAHSKGDIVQTGNDIQYNGKFDTNILGWDTTVGNSVPSLVANRLRGTATGGPVPRLSQNATGKIDTVAGETYSVTSDIYIGTATGALRVRVSSSPDGLDLYDVTRPDGDSIGDVAVFTAVSSTSYYNVLGSSGADGTYIELDNVVTRKVNTTYQATEDTADMYDYDDNDGSVYCTQNETVVYCTGTNATGTIGNFYLWISTSAVKTLSTTDLTATIAWTDLGTATNMSLLNPYFQAIPDVVRQDVFGDTATGIKSFKGLAYFNELSSTDDYADSQGWSKLGNGLYHTGTEEITNLRLRSTLNAGSYHTIYNKFGCALSWTEDLASSDNRPWTATTDWVKSKYATIYYAPITRPNGGAIGGVSGRPAGEDGATGKFYDKVYTEGNGGIIGNGSSISNDVDLDIESSKLNSDKTGLERGVECVEIGAFPFITWGGVSIYYYRITRPWWAENAVVETVSGTISGSIVLTNGNTAKVTGYIWTGVNFGVVVEGDDMVTSIGATAVSITRKANHLLTQGNSLSSDVISDPANYSQDWLNYLASGNAIGLNPLLVGQDGTSYEIGTGSSIDYIMSKKSLLVGNELYKILSTSDWTDFGSDRISGIDNALSGVADNYYIRLISYISQNKPVAQSSPLATIKVQDKVIANNSHSIYKGAMLTNVATGKVAVGNGANGLESRVLENAEIPRYDISIQDGDLIDIDSTTKLLLLEDSPDFIAGSIIMYPSDLLWTVTIASITTANGWIKISTTPSHSTINLDNSVSPASKCFTAEVLFSNNEKGIALISEEMVWDYTLDSGLEFTNTTMAAAQDTIPVGDYFTMAGGEIGGNYLMLLHVTTGTWQVQYDAGNLYKDGNGDIVSYQGDVIAKAWDGNGFGETGEFEQLTNGTLTDLNGNTVKTAYAVKRLGVYNARL